MPSAPPRLRSRATQNPEKKYASSRPRAAGARLGNYSRPRIGGALAITFNARFPASAPQTPITTPTSEPPGGYRRRHSAPLPGSAAYDLARPAKRRRNSSLWTMDRKNARGRRCSVRQTRTDSFARRITELVGQIRPTPAHAQIYARPSVKNQSSPNRLSFERGSSRRLARLSWLCFLAHSATAVRNQACPAA